VVLGGRQIMFSPVWPSFFLSICVFFLINGRRAHVATGSWISAQTCQWSRAPESQAT